MAEHTDESNTIPATLAEALAAFQANLPQVTKGETARVATKDGGQYSYDYADLADLSPVVLPALGRVGLSWSCKPQVDKQGRFVLRYKLRHVSGEQDTGKYPLPNGVPAQQLGSAITYGRRYCLLAVTGVAPADGSDDDGQAAGQATTSAPADEPWARPEEQARKPGSGKPTSPNRPASADLAITKPQLNKLHTQLQAYGIQGRDDGLAYCSEQIGRHLESTKDLTRSEASTLIDQLTVELQQPPPTPEGSAS